MGTLNPPIILKRSAVRSLHGEFGTRRLMVVIVPDPQTLSTSKNHG